MVRQEKVDINGCQFAFCQVTEQPDGRNAKLVMCRAAVLADIKGNGVLFELPLAEHQVCDMYPDNINSQTCAIAQMAINRRKEE